MSLIGDAQITQHIYSCLFSPYTKLYFIAGFSETIHIVCLYVEQVLFQPFLAEWQ